MKKTSLLLIAFIILLLADSACLHRKTRREKNIHGGCCLSEGTAVRLANGNDIYIENLKAGDTVLAYDRVKNIFVPSRVLKMYQTEHDGFIKLNFAGLYRNQIKITDPTSIIVSKDHPIWVKEKGWCSFDPQMTKRILMMKEVKKLEANDVCYTNMDLSMAGLAGNLMLAKIDKIKGPVKAYTIMQLENKLDCFLANGVVVGTEAMTMESGGE